MSDAEITVSGLREVQRSLYAYSQQMGDLVVIRALLEGARLMQKQARSNAPSRTGRLRRGIVVKRSRINNGRRNETLGVYLSLRKGRGKADPKDAFYGRFVEDGWNARGKPRNGGRAEIVQRFGSRSGRKTLPSNTDVPGVKFMGRAFDTTKAASAALIVQAVERGAAILKRRIGLK